LQIRAIKCNLCVIKRHKQFPKKIKVGSVTVKIYRGRIKVSGRKYEIFTVAYHGNGERRRKVFRKLADAKDAAHEIALKIAQGRANAKELSGTDLESYNTAINLLRPHGLPLHSVIEEYLAARERLDGESILSAAKEYARRHRHSDKPVQEVVDELLAAKKRDGLSLRYRQSLRSHLKNGFAQAFHTNIGSITASMIEEWLAGLSQEIDGKTVPLGPRARNNRRMSIVTLFQFARVRGYLPKDQRTEAEHVARAKDRGGEIGILKPQELAKLMKKGDAEAALYLALGAFTGLRSAELIRLEWSDINFERGHLIVAKGKSKTATRRLVPIQPNLTHWLALYRGQTGRVFVSEHAADRTIAFAKEHVKWPANALRHSYASYRLAQTQDAQRVALEMGNSPMMLFTNYRELADEHDAKAWFAIAPKRAANVVRAAFAA
jgi:integrase